MSKRLLVISIFILFFSGTILRAQEVQDGVQINLPTEIELQTLLDYVSERLEIRVLYDDKLASKKISVRAPGKIPPSSLLAVLQSALRMKGLALVDSGTEGWMKIVETDRLVGFSNPVDQKTRITEYPVDEAVTQVFVLKHAQADQVDTVIKPFLTPEGGNSFVLQEQGIIVITDYVSNILRLEGLIRLIDIPGSESMTKFIEIEYGLASEFAQRLTNLIQTQPESEVQKTKLAISHDVRTNQLIIIGNEREIERVESIVKQLDVPLSTTTVVYPLISISASRLDRLVKGVIRKDLRDRMYESAIDQAGNLLIVTTSEAIHSQIRDLIKQLDQPSSVESQSRIRFYPLKYITAAEALETLRGIEGNQANSQAQNIDNEPRTDGRFRIREDQPLNGPNRPQLEPVRELPTPPAFQDEGFQEEFPRNVPFEAINPDDFEQINSANSQGVRVTADLPSNTIIVIADPIAQEIYKRILDQLDQPRPQVLIEAKVVILDTTDDFTLGVEVSAGDRIGDKRLFAFSSFGLSEVDPVNGALSIIPGLGFNGTLVDPDVADVVLRAFTSHRKSKIISAPRVLVNDNAEAILTSVTEIPFTSVNASNTVATTSFAGFADAGTTIQVTPHISEKDQLQIEYRITLNEFQGGISSAGVPPPRQTNEIESVVTIPDGHTLIVGGLHRTSYNQDQDGFPYIEKIPVLREALGFKSESARETSLFIFLRPVILRDDKFRDLKYYSEKDVERADIAPDFPRSYPVLIE